MDKDKKGLKDAVRFGKWLNKFVEKRKKKNNKIKQCQRKKKIKMI